MCQCVCGCETDANYECDGGAEGRRALDLAVLRAVLEQRGGIGHLFDVREVVEEVAGQVAIVVQRVDIPRDAAAGCTQQPFVLLLL